MFSEQSLFCFEFCHHCQSFVCTVLRQYFDCHNLNTFGTGAIPDDEIRKIILDTFDMRPGEIIRLFNLRSPIYAATAAYGHFQKTFPWEKTYKTIHLWEKAEEKEGISF